ncbi:MAG: hypothetical protein G01um10148_330 [Parcubacteria group bacterium Gr01-1014_8]|nr:MAG: hypothetical protein G01um10148_330 [Parcubacteria group bacterium Gr01-1014_8]
MTLEKVLRWIAIIGIFALPFIVLIVSRSLFFPFITGKNFAFRIIVEIVGGAWVALALVNPLYRPRRSWVLLAFTLFVVLIGISDAFGVNPFKSFWSNYERMEGWVTLAHLLVYLVAAVSILNTEQLWKRWWHTSLGVSVLVAFHGLFQLLGFITINQGGVRLDATFGNATYLGVYMLFNVFVAALFLSRAWNEHPRERFMYSSLYGALIILDTFILFFTSTRGAILGLIGGVLFSAALLIVLSPKSRTAWYAGAAIAGLVVLAGMFLLVKDQAWVQGIEPLHRLASIADEGVPGARVMNWGMAMQGFKERPILGWGQENYAVVFDKYYDPQMFGQEPWFDRVHNIIFDWLIAGGLLGLLLYLGIYVFALLAIWRSGGFAQYERAILTGLFAGYFFYLIFTFDNITSYLMFVSLLAYITMRSSFDARPIFDQILPKNTLPFFAVLAVFLVSGLSWSVNAHALLANKLIILALSPHSEGASKNLEYFKASIAYGTYGTQEAREHLSQTAAQAIQSTGVPLDVRRGFLETAAKEMSTQAEDSPLNARFPFFLGVLLDSAGDYNNAKLALERARELSPNKQAILFELGLNALARGDNAAALSIFESAYKLASNFAEARTFYTAVAIHTDDQAVEDQMIRVMVENDQALEPRILSAYASKNRYDKIAALAAAQIQMHPDDVQAHVTYSAALYKIGNVEDAVRSLEELKRVIPGAAAQADSLIADMLNGTLKVGQQ